MNPETNSSYVETPELSQAISDARQLAREQVSAAWQLHLDKIREHVDSGWQQLLDNIFDERFAEVEERLSQGIQAAIGRQSADHAGRAAAEARSAAYRALTERLNGTFRRIRQAESREVLASEILDATADFSPAQGLFTVAGNSLKLDSLRGAQPDRPLPDLVPLSDAPAFATVLDSQDTVVAAATPEELSSVLAEALGRPAGEHVYLFPLVVSKKVISILLAVPPVDVNAIELLTSIASSALDQPVAGTSKTLVHIASVEPPAAEPRTGWDQLTQREQELHLRAQRFARTKVAEMLLHQVQQVRMGRASKNLYRELRSGIDEARESYRQQFIDGNASMLDYLHLELVRTLAKEETDALGPDYPGPLR